MKYGRYQIIKEVGHGSMGVVYQALDPQINRLLAVKVLRQDRELSDVAGKRFMKEAMVIGRLSHPHIATIYDIGEQDGTVYLAMEFLEGKTLSEIIRQTRLDAQAIVKYGAQIAEALDYAHQKGVVHRDIKPSNIIVLPEDQVKITDFGVAHMDDASIALQTQTGEVMGTPAYMSPEQVLGKAVDGRSDIYSLGVILYQLATGQRPFGGEGKTLATVFNEILQRTPPEPRTISDCVPALLSAAIMKALHKEPGERFQSGKEMAAALRHCLAREEPEHLPAAVLQGKKKRRLGLLTAVAAVLVCINVGLYFYFMRQGGFASTPIVREDGPTGPTQDARAAPPPAQPNPAPLEKQPVASQDAKGVQSQGAALPEAPQEVDLPAAPAAPPAPAAEPGSSRTASNDPGRELKKPHAQSQGETAKPLPTAPHADSPPAKQPATSQVHRPAPLALTSKAKTLSTAIKIRATPQGASVFIDGTLKGQVPLTVILPIGEHHLRISSPGYRDVQKQITVEEMMEYPLTFQLAPAAP